MRRIDEEVLADRARDLQLNGLNGLKLVFVELVPAAAPIHAELTVQFQNTVAVTAIDQAVNIDGVPASEIFPLQGGTRILAGHLPGQVRVTAVDRGPGGGYAAADHLFDRRLFDLYAGHGVRRSGRRHADRSAVRRAPVQVPTRLLQPQLRAGLRDRRSGRRTARHRLPRPRFRFDQARAHQRDAGAGARLGADQRGGPRHGGPRPHRRRRRRAVRLPGSGDAGGLSGPRPQAGQPGAARPADGLPHPPGQPGIDAGSLPRWQPTWCCRPERGCGPEQPGTAPTRSSSRPKPTSSASRISTGSISTRGAAPSSRSTSARPRPSWRCRRP